MSDLGDELDMLTARADDLWDEHGWGLDASQAATLTCAIALVSAFLRICGFP